MLFTEGSDFLSYYVNACANEMAKKRTRMNKPDMSENEIRQVDGGIPAREFEGQLWIQADVAIELRSKDRTAIDRLTAERDAAVADAERYRWMRANSRIDYASETHVEVVFWREYRGTTRSGGELDAAIEAAMKEQEQGK